MGVIRPVLLHVSIGPVQGFVAQSRRTRDLWGSSYLLSYLSARAALGVQNAGGEIIQPQLDQDLFFQWVSEQQRVRHQARQAKNEGGPPHVGSMPNRFVARVNSVEEGRQAAEAAIIALQKGWREVCQAVWDKYVADAEKLGRDVAAIWRRQVDHYWEVTWTLSPEEDGGAALARRKLWRTHRLPDEPGDKCMVMPDLQELSGYVRARGEGEAQDRFWEAIRDQAGVFNLPPGDRLCAIALVKRLFVDVSEDAIAGRINASNWPSTVSIAALPWIERVLQHAPEKAREYARMVRLAAPPGAFSERLPIRVSGRDTGGFEQLNGDYFHKGWIADERQCVLSEDDPALRKTLAAKLDSIADMLDDRRRRLGYPATFYALVLADGDRLGQLLRWYGAERVGAALGRFTQAVPQLVRDHSGVVVYAGGDDLLAMLPVTSALRCTRTLREAYRASFEGEHGWNAAESEASVAGQFNRRGEPAEPTMSASVLFAHVKAPLNTALQELRRLLDDVAKDGNGRDSLAVGILKRGGLNAQWVSTWRRPRLVGTGTVDAVDAIETLARHLGTHDDHRLSSSLLYRIRETLGVLCQWARWSPGSWGQLPARMNLPAFLRAEVMSSLTHLYGDREDLHHRVDEFVQAMLDVMGRASQIEPEDPVDRQEPRSKAESSGPSRITSGADDNASIEVGIDGLLISRFLANRGEEGEDA